MLSRVSKDFVLGASPGGKWPTFSRAAPAVHKAIEDVSFEVQKGETVGLLGVNGAGKSTLLQLITGTLTPTSGQVHVNGRISALLELGAGFNVDWSGRQNAEFQAMIFGARRAEVADILARVEAFADIGKFFDQPMKTYSSGMFARVAFAAAIATEPDILIVDEALAVGDARFQNKCFAHFRSLQDKGKTILFVSHDVTTVAQFCTRGIVINQGAVAFDGTAEHAVAAYLKLLYGQARGAISLPNRIGRPTETNSSPPDASVIAKLFDWPPDSAALARRGYYNPHSASAGNAVGHVVDVLVLDVDNQPVLGPIHPGSRLRVAVQVLSNQDIRRPSVGFTLKTKDNTIVFGVRNVMLGQEVPPLAAGIPLVAVFEIDIPLASGDYFVDVGLADLHQDELVIIEWRVSLICLNVISDAQHYGLVDLRAAFSFTDHTASLS